MSLLIEPANQEACKRNVKEQKMRQGTFVVKGREDYLMEHLGFPGTVKKTAQQPPGTPSVHSSAAAALRASAARRRRQPSESGLSGGRVTPLRAAAHHGLAGSASQPALSRGGSQYAGSERGVTPAHSVRSGRPPTSYSVADSCATTEPDEIALAYEHIISKDPVLEVMMKGPPLFSQPLCSVAATRAYL